MTEPEGLPVDLRLEVAEGCKRNCDPEAVAMGYTEQSVSRSIAQGNDVRTVRAIGSCIGALECAGEERNCGLALYLEHIDAAGEVVAKRTLAPTLPPQNPDSLQTS